MRVTLHLQNVHLEGCAQNVRMALQMVEGVKAVQVHREELLADVLFEEPATDVQLREQLLMAGYLAEHKHGGDL